MPNGYFLQNICYLCVGLDATARTCVLHSTFVFNLNIIVIIIIVCYCYYYYSCLIIIIIIIVL